MGIKCSLPCRTSTYGKGCMQPCQCKHGSCHPVTGQCTCQPGYQGPKCDLPCKVSNLYHNLDFLIQS